MGRHQMKEKQKRINLSWQIQLTNAQNSIHKTIEQRLSMAIRRKPHWLPRFIWQWILDRILVMEVWK